MLDYFVYIMLVFKSFPAVATVSFFSLLVPLSKSFFLTLYILLTAARVSQRPFKLISCQKLVKELCLSSPFPFS